MAEFRDTQTVRLVLARGEAGELLNTQTVRKVLCHFDTSRPSAIWTTQTVRKVLCTVAEGVPPEPDPDPPDPDPEPEPESTEPCPCEPVEDDWDTQECVCDEG